MDDFEWDDAKRFSNLAKHGLDFADAVDLFDGRRLLTWDARSTDEVRFATTGLLDGRHVTLVWTPRDGKKRFISLRRARDEERRQYSQLFS